MLTIVRDMHSIIRTQKMIPQHKIGAADISNSQEGRLKRGYLPTANAARTRWCVRRARWIDLISLLVAAAVFVLIAVCAGGLRASEDIQQIRLGPHVFYLPKIWMRDKLPGAGTVTVQKSRRNATDTAQSGPIDASKLDIWPGVYWQPYGARDLPRVIEIIYDSSHGRSPLAEREKRRLDQAALREPDADGFVRVKSGFVEPGRPPQWETFLYKGYTNKIGEPLVVHSNNLEAPRGDRYLSDVNIGTDSDLFLMYHFDNAKFPKSKWWPLYQKVLAFIDFLQARK